MYRRPKFLEILHEIREQMSREANYDAGSLADLVRNNSAQAREENDESDAGAAARNDEQNFKDREPETEDCRRRRKIVYGNRF